MQCELRFAEEIVLLQRVRKSIDLLASSGAEQQVACADRIEALVHHVSERLSGRRAHWQAPLVLYAREQPFLRSTIIKSAGLCS